MNIRNLAGDLTIAVIAQGFSALASTLLTLLLPKILGVEDFGYWQLFIFYAGYVGFFHLGINDGIYLSEGGRRRSEIDKKEINSQFWLSVIVQLLLSLALMVLSVFLPVGTDRSFVVLMTAALVVLSNAGQFLGFLFQAMGETRKFSASVVVESAILLVGIISLSVIGVGSYEPYVLLYCFAKLFRMLFCFIYSGDFFKSGLVALPKALALCFASIKIGIKLMIANIAGSLILGIARILIDANWGIEVFSSVSFALSITTFFMMFISQASMVLFPALRQSGEKDSSGFFIALRDSLNAILPLILLLYFPAIWILNQWLPDYQQSLAYFAYVLPLCIFEGKMDIVGATYLKVLRRESALLAINFVTLVGSCIISVIGACFLHSVEFILLGAIIALGLRSLYSELYIGRAFSTPPSLMSFIVFVEGIVFSVVCAFFPNGIQLPLIAVMLAAHLVGMPDNASLTKKVFRAVFGRERS